MRQLDSIIDSMGMNLATREIVQDQSLMYSSPWGHQELNIG